MLRNVDLYFITDVSGQPLGSIFKDQAVQEEWKDSENLQMKVLKSWIVIVF